MEALAVVHRRDPVDELLDEVLGERLGERLEREDVLVQVAALRPAARP
jgi:hypothetical protein